MAKMATLYQPYYCHIILLRIEESGNYDLTLLPGYPADKCLGHETREKGRNFKLMKRGEPCDNLLSISGRYQILLDLDT